MNVTGNPAWLYLLLQITGPSPPGMHGFNRTTFSPCCLGLGPILLHHCMFLHVRYMFIVTIYCYMHASALTSHATACIATMQCLICYRTHQHVISYKGTKLRLHTHHYLQPDHFLYGGDGPGSCIQYIHVGIQ